MTNVIKRIGNDANMARKIYIDKIIFGQARNIMTQIRFSALLCLVKLHLGILVFHIML